MGDAALHEWLLEKATVHSGTRRRRAYRILTFLRLASAKTPCPLSPELVVYIAKLAFFRQSAVAPPPPRRC